MSQTSLQTEEVFTMKEYKMGPRIYTYTHTHKHMHTRTLTHSHTYTYTKAVKIARVKLPASGLSPVATKILCRSNIKN